MKKKKEGLAEDLKAVFGLKNLTKVAAALGASSSIMTHLRTGKSSTTLANAYRVVIAFAKEFPAWKREEILKNVKKELDINLK